MKKATFSKPKRFITLLLATPALSLFWACQEDSTGSEPGGGNLASGSGGAIDSNEPELTPLGGQLTTPVDYEPVSGSCGFESPAFCDTFEAGPHPVGVAGELDDTRWRAMRAMPSLHPNLVEAFPIGPSWVGDCRADLQNTLVPALQDAVICDPVDSVATRHLLTASGAQNYGLSTYRIRQPFDFEGRTGTISLDVDASSNLLGGWAAIVLSEELTPAPSFNYPERGSGPQNGIAFEFYGGYCEEGDSLMPQLFVFDEYGETSYEDFDCETPHVAARRDALNHVEIRVSERHVEFWASEPSEDGVEFPEFHRLMQAELALPFTRGYVSLVVRNHATVKYSEGASWAVRWDNVGFDGPVISDRREHSSVEAPPPFTLSDGCLFEGQCVWRGEAYAQRPGDDSVCPETCDHEIEGQMVGYVLPREDEEPIEIRFPAVSLESVSRARLAIAVDYPWFEWSEQFPPPTALTLRYRVNGAIWHERAVTEVEARAFEGTPDEGPGAGLLNQVVELDLTELREGENVIEMTTAGTWTGEYRAAATAADLLFELE